MTETRNQMIARRKKTQAVIAKRKERHKKWLFRSPQAALTWFNRRTLHETR